MPCELRLRSVYGNRQQCLYGVPENSRRLREAQAEKRGLRRRAGTPDSGQEERSGYVPWRYIRYIARNIEKAFRKKIRGGFETDFRFSGDNGSYARRDVPDRGRRPAIQYRSRLCLAAALAASRALRGHARYGAGIAFSLCSSCSFGVSGSLSIPD